MPRGGDYGRALEGDVIMHPAPYDNIQRGRSSSRSRQRHATASVTSVKSRALSVSSNRASSPSRSQAPGSLTAQELNAFDVLQMGVGGGIKIDEIVGPPASRRLGAHSGAIISEESDLYNYRGGTHPYSTRTPVLVRLEGSAMHIVKCHKGTHLITLPFIDIKKIEQWESRDRQAGLRVYCGAVAPTEVSIIVNDKSKRLSLYKMLMLKTRGVILSVPKEAVIRRSLSSGAAYLRHLPSSATRTSVSSEAPQHNFAEIGLRDPSVSSNTHSHEAIYEESEATPDIPRAYEPISTLQTISFTAPTPSTQPTSSPSPSPNPVPAYMTDLDRAQRRERIKQQLQERRAEQNRISKVRQEESVGSQSTPTTATSHAIPPSTDEEARKIANERRKQRQEQYEKKLQAERMQRLKKRQEPRN